MVDDLEIGKGPGFPSGRVGGVYKGVHGSIYRSKYETCEGP